MSISDERLENFQKAMTEHIDALLLLRSEFYFRTHEKSSGFEVGKREGCDWLSSVRGCVGLVQDEAEKLYRALEEHKDW